MRQAGRRWRTEHLDVRAITSPLARSRAGLIVPKHGNSSVDRNRLKRRVREVLRVSVLPALSSVDIVVRTFPSAYSASFSMLESELSSIRDMLARS